MDHGHDRPAPAANRVEHSTDGPASAAQLHGVLNSLREGIQVISFDWKYLYVNQAAATQGKRRADDMIGRSALELYPQVVGTPLFAAIERCLIERAPSTVETEFPFDDGSTGCFFLQIEPVPPGACVLSVEVSDLKRAEAALRHERERLAALLGGVNELVHVVDAAGRCADCHVPSPWTFVPPPEACRGAEIAVALGRDAADALADPIARAHRIGKSTTTEYAVRLAGGVRRLETTAVPQRGGGALLVTRDLTARHALEEQLRQAQKMEAVGELTSGIAHDFNNILTVILSNAELIRTALPEDSPIAHDAADVLDAARRGADLVSQLMRFSRQQPLELRPVDVADVARSTAPMLRRLLRADTELVVDTPPEPATAMADQRSIEQALMNLVVNARDAMPDGGTIRVAVELATLDDDYLATHPWMRPGPHVCLRVEDSGHGMSDATKERVFEPFFTTKPEGKGTGLGLAMVYGIIKQHHGVVHLYSEIDIGTSVKLYLPACTTEGTVQAKAPGSRVPDMIARRGETVVLAEDNVAIRRASRRALEAAGYTVIEAADGVQALELIDASDRKIDLVIADVVMPRMGGPALVRALHKSGVAPPVLFTSGYSHAKLQSDASAGATTDFLTKPWSMNDLLAKIRQVLDAAADRG